MNYVIKDLEEIKAVVQNRAGTIDHKKLSKTGNSNTSMQILEDSLSKVHCHYMLEISQSILCNTPINKELHTSLTKALDLFEKTKGEIANTMTKTQNDPITNDHLYSIMHSLGYITNK